MQVMGRYFVTCISISITVEFVYVSFMLFGSFRWSLFTSLPFWQPEVICPRLITLFHLAVFWHHWSNCITTIEVQLQTTTITSPRPQHYLGPPHPHPYPVIFCGSESTSRIVRIGNSETNSWNSVTTRGSNKENVSIKDFPTAVMKIRSSKKGGFVSIFCHSRVKCVVSRSHRRGEYTNYWISLNPKPVIMTQQTSLWNDPTQG